MLMSRSAPCRSDAWLDWRWLGHRLDHRRFVPLLPILPLRPHAYGSKMTAIQVPGLLTFTIAILVFFTGVGLNHLIRPLQRWNIPEAVTGGLLAAVVTLLAYAVLGIEVSFALDAR